MFEREIIDSLKSGGVGIIPTDTLYGVVASVWNSVSIERVYTARSRDTNKACIILIAGIDDLEKFSISLTDTEKSWLENVWPGQVSVMLPFHDEKFRYLSRGTGYLVFRVPADGPLRDFVRATGPLIAPSANPEGDVPAETIEEARKYFGDRVDFYVDGGTLQSKPSTIVKLENDFVTIVRSGVVEIKEESIL